MEDWRIGVDVGASAVKVCALSQGSGRLERAGLSGLPRGAVDGGRIVEADAVGAALERALKSAGIKRGDAVLGLGSRRSVFSRVVEMPLMTDEELVEQVGWEAEQHVPFSLEGVTLDFQVVARHPVAKTMEVLLAATEKAPVEALVEVAEAAGLRPVGCEPSYLAIERLAREDPLGAARRPAAVVDVGARRSQLAVLSGPLGAASTEMEVAGDFVTEAMAKALGVPFEEAEGRKRELSPAAPAGSSAPYRGASIDQVAVRTAESASDDLAGRLAPALDMLAVRAGVSPLRQVLLTGGTARLPGLARALTLAIGVPVARWLPESSLYPIARHHPKVEAVLNAEGSRLGVALGLVYEGWPGD